MLFTMSTYANFYDTGFDFSARMKCNYNEFAQKYRTSLDFGRAVALRDTMVKIAKVVEGASIAAINNRHSR